MEGLVVDLLNWLLTVESSRIDGRTDRGLVELTDG
jgi:hypothetical protein